MLKVNSETRELFIYDAIGPSWAGMVGADDIVAALETLGDGDIFLRINSPGGSVFEADAAVQNLLRHKGKVSVSVDALAASAATLFLEKRFHVTAAPRAMVMIHEPWTVVAGNADALRKDAEILDKMSENVVDLYHGRMGGERESIVEAIKTETWYTAKEALKAGLVDEIVDTGVKAEAKVPQGMFKNTPQALLVPKSKIVDVAPIKRMQARTKALELRN